MVAKDATPLAGGGDCFPTPEDCRLLALGRGQTEVWSTGSTARRTGST